MTSRSSEPTAPGIACERSNKVQGATNPPHPRPARDGSKTVSDGRTAPPRASSRPPAPKPPTDAVGSSRRAVQRPAPPAAGDLPPAGAPDRLRERSDRDAVAGAAGAGAVAVLDTTAQLRHPAAAKSDVGGILTRRAKSKLLTGATLDRLIGLGIGTTPLYKAYVRSRDCAAALVQEDGKLTGRYCGNRWCLICNRIRTAKLRTAYAPILSEWEQPYFVTLTVPNVLAAQLNATVRNMQKVLRSCVHAIRRTDRLEWQAVRKVEVTYNERRGDFHPHYHLVVRNEAAARVLVKRWLERYPGTNAAAQDVRAADPRNVMAELFKYLTKMVQKSKRGDVSSMPAWALDTIFKALRGLRTIQPMGFKVAAAVEDVTDDDAALELTSTVAAAIGNAYWTWHDELTDWVNEMTGELLTGYDPSASMRTILEAVRGSPDG